MNQLAITDLTFFEAVIPHQSEIIGGSIVPSLSVASATALDTRATTFQSIGGNLQSGFNINVRARGSGATAAAAAVSIGGTATAVAGANAG